MSEISLSVVIPVGQNRANNLHLVLTSLDVQSFPKDKFEVCVVNDAVQTPDDLHWVEDYFDICKLHPALDLKYVYAKKHEPGKNTTQPRNRGARNALNPFLVFADSDVILSPNALECYAEDFAENPNRIIVGSYDWLTWMRITPHDVMTDFQSILDERLVHLTIPPDSHSINRDIRTEAFKQYDRHHIFEPKTPKEKMQMYPYYLSMFSGNIGIPANLFWEDIGGYWDALACGAHEDGASGVAACVAGIPLSFDYRIRGAHVNHKFSPEHRRKLWEVEIEMINRRYHLEEFSDDSGELYDHLPSLQTMSKEMLRVMGVDKWETKGTLDEKTGWRGS